jgi:predicted outer membrane lipoprotein
LFRYQQSSDEMTGTTAWARRIPGWSALAEQVIQGGSIDTRVSYSGIPPGQQLAVHSVEMDSVHELVWVYAADDRQTVTFMIPYYPGWTATVYADLREPAENLKARVGPMTGAPAVQTTDDEGWLVVPVPAGEHFLEVRFVDTPVRVVGRLISLASLFGIVAALAYRHLRSRDRTPSTRGLP